MRRSLRHNRVKPNHDKLDVIKKWKEILQTSAPHSQMAAFKIFSARPVTKTSFLSRYISHPISLAGVSSIEAKLMLSVNKAPDECTYGWENNKKA